MSLHYEDETVTLHHGDCIEVMRTLPDNSVDSIVTDPPYGLGFMGKGWDALPPGLEWAEECLRVLKPGGHLLAFGGTRTWHRLAVAVEDAGFEIRDSFAWLYGSGFPKSMDLGKKLPKWEGWGTALKPAFEPVIMARKPFKGTVAANVLEHGTGVLNIDASRIPTNGESLSGGVRPGPGTQAGWDRPFMNDPAALEAWKEKKLASQEKASRTGRFPANVILDEDQAAALDEQSGHLSGGGFPAKRSTDKSRTAYGDFKGQQEGLTPRKMDSGGASRFFYCAKAPKSERPVVDGVAHPTVKPLALMRYLIRMVTPPGGVVLEPFAGSGTTVEAALEEGVGIIAVERDETYLPLIESRIERRQQPTKEDDPMLDIFGGAA